MRVRRGSWKVRAALVAALVLVMPCSTSFGEEVQVKGPAVDGAERPDVDASTVKGEIDAACALLDDSEKRALMDGLLLKLAVMCDRSDLLGQVRQEPREEIGHPDVGTDVPVSDPAGDTGSSTTQSETSLAVSETTGTICSGYNDSYHGVVTNQGYSGFSRSTDGGATFTDGGAFNSSSYGDPSMVWRKSDGYFYYVSLHSSGLGIYRSTDDCQTFQQHAIVHSGGGDDKELTVVDNNPASPYYGYLYVVWTDFGSGQQIKATTSTNGGATWSTPVVLSSASGVQGAWPAVAPDGTVYAGWAAGLFTGTMGIQVSRSTNGGTTWTALPPRRAARSSRRIRRPRAAVGGRRSRATSATCRRRRSRSGRTVRSTWCTATTRTVTTRVTRWTCSTVAPPTRARRGRPRSG